METKEQCEARLIRENIKRIESKKFTALCDWEVQTIIGNAERLRLIKERFWCQQFFPRPQYRINPFKTMAKPIPQIITNWR